MLLSLCFPEIWDFDRVRALLEVLQAFIHVYPAFSRYILVTLPSLAVRLLISCVSITPAYPGLSCASYHWLSVSDCSPRDIIHALINIGHLPWSLAAMCHNTMAYLRFPSVVVQTRNHTSDDCFATAPPAFLNLQFFPATTTMHGLFSAETYVTLATIGNVS